MNGAWRGVTVRLIALDEPAAFDSGLVLVAIPTEVVDHAWLAPIGATIVAFLTTYYGPRLAKHPEIRRAAAIFFVFAFAAAAIAGVFGALITKAAPIQ